MNKNLEKVVQNYQRHFFFYSTLFLLKRKKTKIWYKMEIGGNIYIDTKLNYFI